MLPKRIELEQSFITNNCYKTKIVFNSNGGATEFPAGDYQLSIALPSDYSWYMLDFDGETGKWVDSRKEGVACWKELVAWLNKELRI